MTVAGAAKPRYLPARRGRQARVITDLMTTKAAASDTRGAYSLFEAVTPPSGGWPAHVQRYDDESFYVLEGTYTFLVDAEELHVGPGGYVFVPRGTVHAFVNTSSVPARMLVLITPGGIQETFFDEVGDSSERAVWEPDMARVLAVAPKYGVEFAGEPAEAGEEAT